MVSRIFLNFLLLFVYFIEAEPSRKTVDFDRKDYYLFHFAKDVDLEAFSQELGFEYHEELDYLEDHHIFSIDKGLPEEAIKKRIHHYFGLEEDRNPKHGLNSDKIFFYEKQGLLEREHRNILRYPIYSDEKHTPVVRDTTQDAQQLDERRKRFYEITKTLDITDERFERQWYLFNLDKLDADINVTGLWLQGITGTGVTVGIVDDGLYHRHRELKDNYRPDLSYNYIDSNDDPTPTDPKDTHGTRCAGEVAASKHFSCGVGVAYTSSIAGVRFIGAADSSWLEGKALSHRIQDILIYSCSWGPADTGTVIEDITATSYKAIVKGINEGRGGLGSLYIFGTGNGGHYDDCNYDGYANSPYTITIAAIDANNQQFRFSEPCPCILASTHSGTGRWRIYTTDNGEAKCSTMHTGTSASTPIAAGIIALVLSVRSNLTWRDIQQLIVTTATPFSLDHEGWELLPSGRYYNNYFGFGKLDAYTLVQAAKDFVSLNPQARFSTPLTVLNTTFSQNNGHITSQIYIHEGYVSHYGFKSLEHVGVSLYYSHQRRGYLEVNITSPKGVTSVLAHKRGFDKNSGPIYWTFFTVKHWGESIVGYWNLSVKDGNDSALDGDLYDWQLHFFGESVDSTKTQTIEYPVTTRYPTTVSSPKASPTAPPKPKPSPSSQSPTGTTYTSSLSSSSSSATTSTASRSTTSSSKTKTTQKPSATSTEKPPYYSEGSQITFFKNNALLISIFSVIIVFIIFGHPLPQTPCEESHPNLFQETEEAAMLRKNGLFIAPESSGIDNSDIMYERHTDGIDDASVNTNS